MKTVDEQLIKKISMETPEKIVLIELGGKRGLIRNGTLKVMKNILKATEEIAYFISLDFLCLSEFPNRSNEPLDFLSSHIVTIEVTIIIMNGMRQDTDNSA